MAPIPSTTRFPCDPNPDIRLHVHFVGVMFADHGCFSNPHPAYRSPCLTPSCKASPTWAAVHTTQLECPSLLPGLSHPKSSNCMHFMSKLDQCDHDFGFTTLRLIRGTWPTLILSNISQHQQQLHLRECWRARSEWWSVVASALIACASTVQQLFDCNVSTPIYL